MAQITPVASNDVQIVVFPSKDDDVVDTQSNLKRKVILGLVYTLVSSGCLYGCVAAVTFFGELFALLLVLTRHMTHHQEFLMVSAQTVCQCSLCAVVDIMKSKQITSGPNQLLVLPPLMLTTSLINSPAIQRMKTHQVTPLSLDEVSVTIPIEDKRDQQGETRTLQQNLRLGLASITAIYLFMLAVEFINGGLLLLLAATQQH
eukprot:jgi/Phyca11/20277/fgenesh1_pg.PHYCAscaffold_61_\